MLRTSDILVPKGKLTLIPMMPMTSLGSKPTACSFGKIKVGEKSFEIYGSRLPSITEDTDDPSSKFNVAFLGSIILLLQMKVKLIWLQITLLWRTSRSQF